MSKYTTEVRWICESKSGFDLSVISSKSVDEIIDAAWQEIFDFSYNFYNNDWNEKIAKFILKYYYTREIGLETVGLWKLKLNTRCNEIAEKYRPMIAALDSLTIDDFNSNYKFTGTNERTDDLTRTRGGESKDKYSDTPQNGLSSVENGTYLSSYRNIEANEEISDTGTQTTEYGETGYKGAGILAAEVSKIDYNAFNVLEKIAREFSDLFMLIW